MADLAVRNTSILTPRGVVEGDLAVVAGRISAIGPSVGSVASVASVASVGARSDELDGRGFLVVPGFVQAHVHLCQTLFRGLADDLDVVDWLRERIWPLEQAHDAASLYASASLGAAELLTSGTTTVLSMETTRHTEQSFAACEDLGIRALIGPALMDSFEPGTEMEGQTTAEAVESVDCLLRDWHAAADGRLGLAVSPRGPRNATPGLWELCVELAARHGLRIHTHVGENRAQAELLSRGGAGRDVELLDRWGALGPSLVMAHCVWLDQGEQDAVAATGAHVCHCPSANLKLASGVAPVPEYLDAGINVALGTDGAACNNSLSAFSEMRTAALVHKPRRGPQAMPASRVYYMATMGGARALGLGGQIGSLEVGKAADFVLLRRDAPHLGPTGSAPVLSQLVYAHTAADVDTVVVAGRVVVRAGEVTGRDPPVIQREAVAAHEALLRRSGLTV